MKNIKKNLMFIANRTLIIPLLSIIVASCSSFFSQVQIKQDAVHTTHRDAYICEQFWKGTLEGIKAKRFCFKELGKYNDSLDDYADFIEYFKTLPDRFRDYYCGCSEATPAGKISQKSVARIDTIRKKWQKDSSHKKHSNLYEKLAKKLLKELDKDILDLAKRKSYLRAERPSNRQRGINGIFLIEFRKWKNLVEAGKSEASDEKLKNLLLLLMPDKEENVEKFYIDKAEKRHWIIKYQEDGPKKRRTTEYCLQALVMVEDFKHKYPNYTKNLIENSKPKQVEKEFFMLKRPIKKKYVKKLTKAIKKLLINYPKNGSDIAEMYKSRKAFLENKLSFPTIQEIIRSKAFKIFLKHIKKKFPNFTDKEFDEIVNKTLQEENKKLLDRTKGPVQQYQEQLFVWIKAFIGHLPSLPR